MDMKTQLISLSIIAIVLYGFFRNKRLPLRQTRVFSAFLIISAFDIIMEIASLYCLYNFDTTPIIITRITHQIFIGSMISAIFLLYSYIISMVNEYKKYSWRQLLLRSIPFLGAMAMVVFGELNYQTESDSIRYSFGPMATTVYIIVGLYMLMSLIVLIREKQHFSMEKRIALGLAVASWVVISIIQFSDPTKLLSSFGLSIMVLFIFMSFENPREYIDHDTNLLNRNAFNLMLSTTLKKRKTFFVINLNIEGMSDLFNANNRDDVFKLQTSIANSIMSLACGKIYLSSTSMISIIASEKQRKLFASVDFENIIDEKCRKLNICENVPYHITILECPKFAKTQPDIINMLWFLRKNPSIRNNQNRLIYIDEKFVEKLNYYHSVEQLIQKAVAASAFDVYYQPIYSVKDKCFASAEALVRLQDTTTIGFVSPEVFIPIAEEKGLIRELGAIVFQKVCSFASTNQLQKLGVKYIEVNISGVQGVDEGLPDLLQSYIQQFNIPPQFINLEITETAAVASNKALENNMNILIKRGFSFSMDDFGTGYSNLAKMADYNFELIKLDKSLIWPCFPKKSDDPDSDKKLCEKPRVILANCINMILSLGMGIVAEGVETQEQAELLTECGVNYLQGYFFSRPVPEKDYLEFLLKNNSVNSPYSNSIS